MGPYEEVILTIKEDLLTVPRHKNKQTSISELQQIDILLKTFESRHHNLKQLLPKLEHRQGLIDFGGAVLKTLFRSAIVSDVRGLNEVFNELQGSQTDVIHSISKQVTYVEQLEALTGVNSGVIANLSSIVKDVVIHSHDKFTRICSIP